MLSVNNLSIEFSRYDKGWQRRTLHPVRDLSLRIGPGEIVAVVGSSGSGKSLLAHAVLGLLPGNACYTGDILFRGEPVTPRNVKRLRGKRIALIPQSVAYLNPLAKVGRQVYRASRLSGQCGLDAARNTDCAFARYRLEAGVKAMYPFQVSGGMARRVLTATATAGDADLLIADEPTTGLDAGVIRQSLDHLRELADSGKGIMLITHDIDAAVTIADRVAVIYAGTTVETAPASDFTTRGRLRHPYTRALWNALPQQGFRYVPGNQPMEDRQMEGCIYGDRCADRGEDCKRPQPLRAVDGGLVRCCHA
jgi:peptide/nickel transport system ATP-binding protein